MARNLAVTYPNRAAAGTIDYPYGLFRNVVKNADGTGTPLEAEWLNDLNGFLQSILIDANIIPNGTTDTGLSSQYLNGIKKSIIKKMALSGNAVFESTSKMADGELLDGTVLDDTIIQELYNNGVTVKTQGFYDGTTVGGATYKFLNLTDSTAQGYVTGYSRFQIRSLDVYACLDVSNGIDLIAFGVSDTQISTSAVQSAIDLAATLNGSGHDTSYVGVSPTPPAFFQQYGAVRTLQWPDFKVRIDNTIYLKNCVSIASNGGGVIADPAFYGTELINTDNNPYNGTVDNFTVDCNETDAKGIVVRSASKCNFKNITVASVKNDGFTHVDGPECMVDGLHVITSKTPLTRWVCGFKSTGADSVYSNIVTRFSPVGIMQDGGGNNEYVNCHPWGLYSEQKMYIGAWLKDTVGNNFTNLYSDSPTKNDYGNSNFNIELDGFYNGGFAILVQDSQDNIINGRVFINEGEYTAASLPVSNNLYMCAFLGDNRNTVNNLIERPGSGIWFPEFYYSSTTAKALTITTNIGQQERDRKTKQQDSQNAINAIGFSSKLQNLGDVSGNWGLDLSEGSFVKLNTIAPTNLVFDVGFGSDTYTSSVEFKLLITGTDAPTFSKSIRTPNNTPLPTPSVRGLLLDCVYNSIDDVIYILTVSNL